ncbi:MAG: beta strand repeat-containing protein [Novosphingobium sp.]
MTTYTGSKAADTFTGSDGDDTIDGNGGKDTLKGGGGNDTITGGAGSDTIMGGDGDDRIASGDFLGLDSGIERDVINGGAGSDRISIGYGDSADGGDGGSYGDYLFISFLGAPKGISFDLSKGTQTIGGGTITGFENLSLIEGSNFDDVLSGADLSGGYTDFTTIRGMGGNDQITGGYYTISMDGGDGDDTINIGSAIYTPQIHGGKGNDTINAVINNGAYTYGDEGNDKIVTSSNAWGGTGNDTITVQFGYYGASAYGEAGTDTLKSGGNNAVFLVGGSGADRLIGGSEADDLVTAGSTSGTDRSDNGRERDIVKAGGGDDRISAGIGDNVDGGAGTDHLTLSLAGAAAGQTVSTANLFSNTGTFAGGTIRNVEIIDSLVLGGFADKVTVAGSSQPKVIDGGGGADLFMSQGQDVLLLGGEGNDRLVASAQGGVFDGGEGTDTASFAAAKAGVHVQIIETYGGGFIGGVTELLSVETVAGSEFADTLSGGSQDDTLIGGGGDDTLRGGAGNDTLKGGDGTDRLVGGIGNDTYVVEDALDTIIEQKNGGTDTVRTGLTTTLADQIENLILTGPNAVNGTGNGAANLLAGNAGANQLLGLGGADTLRGGAGDDLLFGGAGNDTLTGGMGSDQFAIGGSGGGPGSPGVDRITGFASGTDTLLLINPSLSGALLAGGLVFGTSAQDADDFVIYNKALGNLYVDFDGNGAGAKVLVATLTPGTDLAASDIVLITEDAFNLQIGGGADLPLLI